MDEHRGYLRHPTLRDDAIVFVSDDDLWRVPADGGIARRLTAGLSEPSTPCLSPDGAQVAFVGRDEQHPEVYLMPGEGGPGTVIVNTHATFRWKHGLFHAYDHTQMHELDADLYVTLVDNVDAVHERLEREHEIRHTLKDILVWREEEIVVTEAMADVLSPVCSASSEILMRGP